MAKKKLKLGLITREKTIPAWAFVLLENIRQSDYAELKLVIYKPSGNKSIKPGKSFLKKIRFFLFYLHQALEKIAFKPKPDALKKHPISNLKECDLVTFDTDNEKLIESAAQQKIQSIISKEIDLFIALCPFTNDAFPGIISKYGIWSVGHTADLHTNTTPTAVWEVLHQKDITQLCLWVQNHKISSRPSLFKASFATIKNSTRWNRSFYYWKAASVIQAKLERLHKLGWNALLSEKEENTDLELLSQGLPGNRTVSSGFIRILRSYLAGKVRNVFFLEQWIILFSLHDNDEKGGIEGFHRILPPKNSIWADPFVIKKENKYYIFAEEMRHKESKGRIILIESDITGVHGEAVCVLEADHHLSYPYLFQDDGQLYMMPEASQNRSIDLYQCTKFPDEWVWVDAIMKGVEAADASLLKYDNKYWLFANMRKHQGVSINDDLYVFYSQDLIGGQWKPHPMNPVVSDVRFSRPAGQIFFQDNRLIRPAQDCSRRYGYALHLMEISKLSETEYKERVIKTIMPDGASDVLGIHTFNKAQGIRVMDAQIKRKKFTK